MFKIINVVSLCLLIILDSKAQNSFKTKTEIIDSQTICLKLKADVAFSQIQNLEVDVESKFKVNAVVSKMFFSRSNGELSRIYKFRLENSDVSEDILRYLEKKEYLEYAEFAPIFQVNSVPNDLRNVQWNLRKISAIQAWNIRVGDPSILLAIVDDGVDINHEDLKSVIYTNTGEIPGNNNDDDNNGYIDDVHGWNATYRIPNPNPPFQNRKDYTHGTHCAGIAGAATNNAVGIASIGSNITILPISTSDSINPGTIYAGYEGIVYAVDNGARVISLSWGSSYFSRIGQDVVADAVAAGAIIVAAAGNSNSNLQTYPASYNGVIAVGATDSFDRKAAFSNYGTWVDVFAPGVDIWSSLTGTNQKYGYMSGTSMSCPMVAGLCALILSQNDLLTPAQVEACLKSGADNINALNPGYSGQLGAGRINAYQSLKCIKPLFANFKSDIKSICPGNSITFTNKSSQSAISYLWSIPGAVPSSSTQKNPTFLFPVNGQYAVKLRVSDGTNSDSVNFTNYIQVVTPSAQMINSSVKVKLDESAFLGVNLTGTPPFKIKVTDGSNVMDFYNIKMNVFYFDVAPSVNSKYYLLSMSDAICSGKVSDTAYVVVDTTSKQNSGGGNTCATFDLFTKTYDFGSKEQPYFIYALRDGNIAIAGLSDKKLIGGDDIFLTKLRPDGAVIWTKYYGTTSNEIGYPINIFDDKEFNIYISGASLINSPNTSYYFKLDSSGNNIDWTNKHNGNGVQDQIANGLELSNGNLFYIGTSAITSDQAGSAFINTKSNSRLWGRSFDTPGNTEHNIMVKELYKKLYVLGRTSFGSGGYGSYLMKLDLSGNVAWQKYIDYPFYDAGMFETITHQNSIMTVHWLSINGSSRFGSQDIGVFHCDTNGNKIWSKIIGTTARDDAGGLVRLGNYYYISGITYAYDAGNPKVFLIKLDINANIIWTKVYGATGERLIKTQHSNLMTVGSDGSLNILAQKYNSTDDVILFKIDECGNSSCPSVDVTFSISNDNTSFSNSSFKDLGLLSVSAGANSVKTSGNGNAVSNYCPPVKSQISCDLVPIIKYKLNCMSDSVRFTDSSYSTTSNHKIKNYKWVFHDSSIVFGKNVAFRYPKAGSYTVKLVVFSDTPNACSETKTVVIDVQDKLKAKINAGSVNQCIGDSVDLSVSIECGQAPYSIYWLPSNYFKQSNSASTKVSVPTTMYIKCFVRDANGATTVDSVLITLNKGCCAYMPDFMPSSENICLGQTINFTQNPIFSNSNSKYDVYLNGSFLETINQQNVNAYQPLKPGLYKVILEVNGNCKKGTTEREFYVHPLPFADAGRDTILCEEDTIALGLPALAQHVYEWNGGGVNISDSMISNPYFVVNQSSKLYLRVKDRMTGCVALDSIFIDFGNNLLDLGNDTAICEGAWLDLVAGNQKFNTKYLWNNGSINPKFKIVQPGLYFVTKTNQCGTTQDTINVGFKLCFCELIMPNAFSPDANAINEYFPEHYLDTTIDILIYNRWGEKLFEAENTNIGWDGTYKGERVQQDVYLYIIRYRNCRGRYVYLKGTFTLLR